MAHIYGSSQKYTDTWRDFKPTSLESRYNLQPNQNQATKCWMTKCSDLKLSSTLSIIVTPAKCPPPLPPVDCSAKFPVPTALLNRNPTSGVLSVVSAICLPTQMRTNQCLNDLFILKKNDNLVYLKCTPQQMWNWIWGKSLSSHEKMATRQKHNIDQNTLFPTCHFTKVSSDHIWN